MPKQLMSKVTLSQWCMLAAVIDHGSYAKAAEIMHKSPSTLNHAVHKLEEQLGVELIAVDGRQISLTEVGSTLLRRARQLIDESRNIERLAEDFSSGIEAEVAICIDQIYPMDVLTRVMDQFSQQFPYTRVQLFEGVLNGGRELLLAGKVDLLVSSLDVAGYLGTPLGSVDFLAAAHPDHPLHALGRSVDLRDLRAQRQIVIRDSAQRQAMDSGWLKADQRLTVGHASTALEMLRRGLGFAWVTRYRLEQYEKTGELKRLSLTEGGIRRVAIQLYYKAFDGAGLAVSAMAQLLEHELSNRMYRDDDTSMDG